MKRFISLVATTAAVGALVIGCSSATPEEPQDDTTSTDNSVGEQTEGQVAAPAGLDGKLAVCMDISFPPMEYYEGNDTSNPVGVDVDLAHAIGEQLGVEVRLQPTSFDGLLPALAASRCDTVISGILITEERTKQVPAVGYLDTHRVILVADGNPKNIASVEDLAGMNLALEGGTNYETIVEGWNEEFKSSGETEINIQRYPKQTDAVQQLLVGRADAVVTQDTEAAFRMTEDPGKFGVGFVLEDRATFGVYYNQKIDGLGEALEAVIEQLKSDGTIDQIADDHNLVTEAK